MFPKGFIRFRRFTTIRTTCLPIPNLVVRPFFGDVKWRPGSPGLLSGLLSIVLQWRVRLQLILMASIFYREFIIIFSLTNKSRRLVWGLTCVHKLFIFKVKTLDFCEKLTWRSVSRGRAVAQIAEKVFRFSRRRLSLVENWTFCLIQFFRDAFEKHATLSFLRSGFLIVILLHQYLRCTYENGSQYLFSTILPYVYLSALCF